MRKPLAARVALAGAALVCTVTALAGYTPVGDWLKLPAGHPQLGNMHGDIAVSSKGEVFVSIQGPPPACRSTRPTAPSCATSPARRATSTGSSSARTPTASSSTARRCAGQTIVKMKLDGTIVMTIGSSAVPDEFKVRNARSNELQLLLTGLDVAPNGDLYVADGYASDYIHRFDRDRQVSRLVRQGARRRHFNTLHKLAIDTRFQPARIIAVDRANNRVVHLSLTGEFLGVVASDLLLPAALTLNGDNVVVGELRGRVTVLDKAGKVVEQMARRWRRRRHQPGQARSVAAGPAALAARRRNQRPRQSIRVGIQSLRTRAPFQSSIAGPVAGTGDRPHDEPWHRASLRGGRRRARHDVRVVAIDVHGAGGRHRGVDWGRAVRRAWCRPGRCSRRRTPERDARVALPRVHRHCPPTVA